GLLFFFLSRRRHTRWPRDWSSDVCSSDLVRFRRYWAACFATRRRRPRWLSPFKWLALTTWAPWTLSRRFLLQKFLSSTSCHTPQVKPRHLNDLTAHASSCWTAVL